MGIAGELGLRIVLSWTSRSKICEVAGDERRGEPLNPRLGDEGKTNDCSPWVAQVEDWAADSFDASRDRVGGLVVAEFDFDGDCDRVSDFEASVDFLVVGVFFFPNPNKLRFLLFASFLESSVRLSSSSMKSLARGVALFNRSSARMASAYRPPGATVAGSAELMMRVRVDGYWIR